MPENDTTSGDTQQQTPTPGGDQQQAPDPNLLNGGGTADDKAPPPAFPDDWRQQIAGDDASALKRLERIKSPADLFTSYTNLERKMSAGQRPAAPEALPENATDEQKAAHEQQLKAYRADAGIPDTPEGYLSNLDGLVIGDDDKEAIDGFLKEAHGQNLPPAAVATALKFYTAEAEKAQTAQVEADRAARAATEDTLRQEWGGEYRANVNSISNFLDTAPDGMKEQLLGARLADGSLLGDNEAALRWLSKLASDANPAGFVAPGTGMGQLQSVEQELADIRSKMGTDAYTKSPQLQERYRKLLDAQAKLSA